MKRKLGYLLGVMLIMSLTSYGIIRWNKTSHVMKGEKKEELVIVTSFYPMYIATLNIVEGIEGIKVINLTENQTGCVHDYQLTTEDMRQIVDADIAIMNGGELEGFMEEVLLDYPDLKVITASEGIEFLVGSEHSHEEAHEEDYEEDHEEAREESQPHEEEHSHEHSAMNGHVWMNMNLYQQQISTIARYLGIYDSWHADSYHKNAKIYLDKVEDLKNEYHEISEKANGKEIIIFHDAFAYLAQQLGMEVVHTVDTDSESTLSAGEIAEVIEEVKLYSINFLFTEEQFSTEIADRVAAETSAQVYIMDSLVTGEEDKDAYLVGMRKNLEVLKKAIVAE